jgi:hypothetical protein
VENVGTQNHRRNLFQGLSVERAQAANRQIGVFRDVTCASNAATAIKQEKYSTGLKLGRLFAQPQALPDVAGTHLDGRAGPIAVVSQSATFRRSVMERTRLRERALRGGCALGIRRGMSR